MVGEVILIAVVILLVIAVVGKFIEATNFSRDDFNDSPDDHYYDEPSVSYEDEITKETYRATKKSFKVRLLQMDALRKMAKVAKRHTNLPHDDYF